MGYCGGGVGWWAWFACGGFSDCGESGESWGWAAAAELDAIWFFLIQLTCSCQPKYMAVSVFWVSNSRRMGLYNQFEFNGRHIYTYTC